MTSNHVAAVDIGTNSVRLLITDAQGREQLRLMRITRLGQGVDRSGKLHPEAVRRTLDVLSEYGQELRRAGVERVRGVATSAARDATNRDAFFRDVQHCLGVVPELLSGDDEARLSFQGATRGLAGEAPPFVVFDIGGGSTEFARGSDQPEAFISTDVGCVRISERFLHADPPTRDELARAEAEAQRWLELVAERIPACRDSKAQTWVGLAGTVTSIAALVMGLDHYDPSRTHGTRLERPALRQAYERLRTSTLERRSQLLLEPQRAGVIVGGAVVLMSLVRFFDLDEIVVSERDILDGLAASLRPGQK